MAEPGLSLPVRRRRRPALSCVPCRQRKIRCNREQPCSNCTRNVDGRCFYDSPLPQPHSPSRQERKQVKIAPLKPVLAETNSVSSTANPYGTNGTPESSASSNEELDSVRRQISQLEEQLCHLRGDSSASTSIPFLSAPGEVTEGGTDQSRFGFHDSELFGCTQFASRSVLHKRRLFGQSHWVNTAAIFRDIFVAFDSPNSQGMTELVAHVRKGKELGRFIKAHLEPTWPTVPTLDLPPRDLADQLIERYILTSESVHRIVHIPTLRREFESAWSSTTKLDLSQVIMLKLVMAIGAATHDAQFTLRGLATLWVYEAIAWLSRPEYKSRLYIRHIQMAMLLILARQTVGVGSSVTWMSMGELLRTAIFAGLHRDPSRLPRQTFFASELRRRLWNTLLEMELQSSLETGAMPSFAMHHFDTRPPGNYDDEQLDENEPEAKSEEIYTNMSIARALRKTYAVRLAIAKSLNEIGPPATYKDTLLLDTKLRAAYKHVSQYLPQWKPSDFQARYMDGIIRRSLMALHMPFFGPSLTEIAYAYTRKVVVDNALTLWRAFFTPSSQYVSRTPNRSGDTNVEPSDFSMLMAYRPGTFRGVVIQTINILLADARAQAQENDTLGVTESSSDCREVLEEAKDWSLQCIRMGEVNIKGYLFIAMIGGQIQAIKRGAGHDESQAAFIQSVAEAANYCVSILEERVAALVSKDQREADVDALNAQQLFQPVDDWGTSTLDTEFDFGIMNPGNWLFVDDMVDVIGI